MKRMQLHVLAYALSVVNSSIRLPQSQQPTAFQC